MLENGAILPARCDSPTAMLVEFFVAGLLRHAINKNPEPQLAINQLAARTLGKSFWATFASVWWANKTAFACQHSYQNSEEHFRNGVRSTITRSAYSPATRFALETANGTTSRFTIYSLPVTWGMTYHYSGAATDPDQPVTWDLKFYTPVFPGRRAFVRWNFTGTGIDNAAEKGGFDSGFETSD